MHRRVAQTISDDFAALARAQPEVLARHWTEAGETEAALIAWTNAGDSSLARRAFKEAEDAYRLALEILETQAESSARDQRQLDLLSSLGQVLNFTKGWNAPETAATADKARELAEKRNNLPQLVSHSFVRWGGVVSSGDLNAAVALADKLLVLAEREGSPAKLGLAYVTEVNARYFGGDLLGSEENYARGLKFFEAAQKEPGLSVLVYGFASNNAWMMGRADTARERMKLQLAAAAKLDSPFQLAFALFVAAMLELQLRQFRSAEALADRSISLSVQNRFPIIGHLSRIVLGRARAALGSPTEGVCLIRDAIAALPETDRNGMTMFLGWLAEAQSIDGAIPDALATVEVALETNPMERAAVVDALRIRGDLRVTVGQIAEAEGDLREAISRGQKIGAKALELRAATSLARSFQMRGAGAIAHDLLAATYALFTEGFDTADLKDARALLEELSDSP